MEMQMYNAQKYKNEKLAFVNYCLSWCYFPTMLLLLFCFIAFQELSRLNGMVYINFFACLSDEINNAKTLKEILLEIFLVTLVFSL